MAARALPTRPNVSRRWTKATDTVESLAAVRRAAATARARGAMADRRAELLARLSTHHAAIVNVHRELSELDSARRAAVLEDLHRFKWFDELFAELPRPAPPQPPPWPTSLQGQLLLRPDFRDATAAQLVRSARGALRRGDILSALCAAYALNARFDEFGTFCSVGGEPAVDPAPLENSELAGFAPSTCRPGGQTDSS